MSGTKLRQEVWENEKYYYLAKEGSLDTNHPGMKILKKASMDAETIADLGCGEGTRLNQLLTKRQNGIGIDISKKALEMGRKSYPKIIFIEADLKKIPLPSGKFDLVYSAYVLEHITNPNKVLSEAIRLLSPGGKLILIAPNFGAPNRASPPFKGSRINKLIEGLLEDFVNLILKKKMNWNKVNPIANAREYDVDWDTTIEPYIRSLIDYLRLLGLKIRYYNSCWNEELPNAKIHQRLFRFLGELGVYPFKFWGPHLVVEAQK